MAGDRKKCLRAGMDEYLSKPVRKTELYNALKLTIGNTSSDSVERTRLADDLPAAAIDWEAALVAVDGDRDLLGEIATAATDELRGLIDRLIESITNRDAPGIERTAHSVKGVLHVFQNVEATGLAQELETLGRKNRLDGIDILFTTLKSLLENILAELRQFNQTPSAGPTSSETDASS